MDDSKKYLKLLDENCEEFLFACFDYRKQLEPKIFYGEYERLEPRLRKANSDSFCIYVNVNETKGKSRKKKDIIRCRAIWVEDDTPRKEYRKDFPLEPSLIIESSPNKYHYYWLTSTDHFDVWNAVMQTMVDDWGCDKSARDISRVLRLPGYIHKKNLDEPFVTKIVGGCEKRYEWAEIIEAFQPKVEINIQGKAKTTKEYSEQDAIQALLTSENYHNSLVSISMSLTNSGVSRNMQYFTLFGLMNAIPEEMRRPEWEARVSEEHLYECIDSGIRKFEEEQEEIKNEITSLPDIELKSNIIDDDIQFPPGLAGQLCEEILEMAPYKNKVIALAGGMGLLAGIMGRKFNVLGMGLNLYIAVLADSGIGKANLKDSINLALRSGKMNTGAVFAGPARFTGPKAIFDTLQNGMSRISVMEEAGILSESTAGDVAGLSRVMLDLFTSSGCGKWAGFEGYSDSKNSIPPLHSPALSVVQVSTPKSFLRALKSRQADVSGEVARLWMIRSMGKKPYLNRDPRKTYSPKIQNAIGDLIKICISAQNSEAELKVYDVDVPEEFLDDSDYWVDRENEYLIGGDTIRRTLCSRAFAKIIKMAAIVSVFNDKKEIGVEEYEWAKQQVNKEIEFIESTFTAGASDDMTALCKDVVAPVIVKILKNGYSDKAKQVNNRFRDHGVFTKTAIYHALKNNNLLKEIDDDPQIRSNPKTGLEKCLDHMVSMGWLHYPTKDKMRALRTKAKCYQISSEFKIILM